MQLIAFNKKGHDPFIDFLKAWCILVVVFCHGFPYLKEIGYAVWGVQIPLFFLIQVFHSYKREPKPINWKMILKRIITPFLIIEALIFVFKLLIGGFDEIKALTVNALVGGGYGPGSYYPWIYIQMAILIPTMRPICEKLGKWKSLFVFILICEVIEVVCSIINLQDSVYRLLCLRYVFLIWLGWLWVKEGIRLDITTIVLSILSLGFIIYLAYFKRDCEPWLFNTDWITHRWVCYFWVGWLFVGILYWIYTKLKNIEIVKKCVKNLASASYEIFLIQMAYYALLPLRHFDFIENTAVQFVVWFALAFGVSIIGGIGLYIIEKKYIMK